MICMECLSESDKGEKADVKNYDEDFIVSCDKPALACGMCVLCSCRPVRYSIPACGRSFHTLRYFELWLRIGAMGSRNKDDYRRDCFPGNTDSRYVPDSRHRIAKDLYTDDLRNIRDTTGAYPERVCPCFEDVRRRIEFLCRNQTIVRTHGQDVWHTYIIRKRSFEKELGGVP